MKKLQVAIDLFDEKSALEILEQVGEYVDIIEIGTPLCISAGMGIVSKVKALYPDKTVFADIKIMDGGSIMSKIAFDAGADMVSVMAVSKDETIEGTITTARKYGRKVLVDMCAVKDMEGRGKRIEAMSPDYICCHVGYDIQVNGVDPVAELHRLDAVNLPKAIAGGIKLSTFEQAVSSPADDIIVGGGLYNQPDMHEVAKKMREILEKNV